MAKLFTLSDGMVMGGQSRDELGSAERVRQASRATCVLLAADTDADRASRLANALAANAVDARVQKAPASDVLKRAKQASELVVVLWSFEASAAFSPADQALMCRLAKSRKLLIATLDAHPGPAKVPEGRILPLLGWRSKSDHAFVVALAQAIHRDAAGARSRLLAIGGIILAAATFIYLMADRIAGIPEIAKLACSAPITLVSDGCGALHVEGHLPRAERLFWEKVDKHDCAALSGHADRFPGTSSAKTAQELLLLRRPSGQTRAAIVEMRQTSYLPRGQFFSSRAGAERDAHVRAGADARLTTCAPVQTSDTLIAAVVRPLAPRCFTSVQGVSCGLDYEAICTLQRAVPVERCG